MSPLEQIPLLMAATMNQAADTHISPNARDADPPAGGRSRWRIVVWMTIPVVIAAIIYFARQESRQRAIDRAIEQQLTGKWIIDTIRPDGTVDPWIWEFRRDGGVRVYPQRAPIPATAVGNESMWWHVSDGLFVLTYDRQFSPSASFRSRAKRVIGYVKECIAGENRPLALYDRCLIDGVGSDSIELTLHPDEIETDSIFRRDPARFTRASDSSTESK